MDGLAAETKAKNEEKWFLIKDCRRRWRSGSSLGIHGRPDGCVQYPDVLRYVFAWGVTLEPSARFWPVAALSKRPLWVGSGP